MSKLVLIFIAMAAATLAQNPLVRWAGGTAAPGATACDATAEVGSVYVQTGDPATVTNQAWICRQTGAASFAWHPVDHFAGTTLPTTCTSGQIALDTDATTGRRIYGCEAGSWVVQGDGGGTGDVVGPGASTDNALARFDLTTGKLIQNSAAILSDADILALPAAGGVTIAEQASIAATTQYFRIGAPKASYDATHIQSAFDDSPYLTGMLNQPNQIVTWRVINQNNTAGQYVEGLSARVLGNAASGTTPLVAGLEGDAFCAPTGTGIVDFCVGTLSQANAFPASGGVVNNTIGHLIYTATKGATSPVSNYGLYLQNQAGIGSSNNYNLFSVGPGLNYLGGITLFGSYAAFVAPTANDPSVNFATGPDQTTGLTSGNMWNNSGVMKWYDGAATKIYLGVTAASSTVGQTLRVTGASTYAFGALDLADADAVTGVLPDANVDGALMRDSELAAFTVTKTNMTYSAEGTGNVLTTVEKVYITAAGCNNATASTALDLPTANAATPVCIGTTTTTGLLEYADAATQVATVHHRLPSDWTSTGGLDIDLIYTGSTSSTNNIRWQVSTSCVADTEDLIAPSYNATSASNNAGPTTAGQRRTAAFAAIAVTNCAASETLYAKIERIGADAGDTYTGIGRLHSAEITMRRAQ